MKSFTDAELPRDMRLALFASTAAATPVDAQLQATARQMQAEVNESPEALQGPTIDIKRPGNTQDYLDSAMVGWKPLR
jgi:hypothetical protein